MLKRQAIYNLNVQYVDRMEKELLPFKQGANLHDPWNQQPMKEGPDGLGSVTR